MIFRASPLPPPYGTLHLIVEKVWILITQFWISVKRLSAVLQGHCFQSRLHPFHLESNHAKSTILLIFWRFKCVFNLLFFCQKTLHFKWIPPPSLLGKCKLFTKKNFAFGKTYLPPFWAKCEVLQFFFWWRPLCLSLWWLLSEKNIALTFSPVLAEKPKRQWNPWWI